MKGTVTDFCLIRSVIALLRYFISTQNTPNLYSTYLVGVCEQNDITVHVIDSQDSEKEQRFLVDSSWMGSQKKQGKAYLA